MRVLLAIVLAAGAPAVHHTAEGTKGARSSLLSVRDLGKGWTASAPTSQRGVELSCAGHEPSARGIVERGAASSPSFSASQAGPFVQQTTSVYASTAQVNAWWRRAVTPSLVACAAGTIEALRARGVKVTAATQAKLRISTALPHTASYRVVATANGKKLYFDLIVLGSGDTISAITISSFVQPVPARVETALARIVVAKLGGPAA